MEFLLFYECNAKTSPAAGATYGACTPLETTPQARVDKELENGNMMGLDYALIAIDWIGGTTLPGPSGTPARRIKFPRAVSRARPAYDYGGELVAIGHPADRALQGEPTQAAAGTLLSSGEPHPMGKSGFVAGGKSKEYSHVDIKFRDGASGGGIYNEEGHIIGIVTGGHTVDGVWTNSFLNLSLVAGKIVKDSAGSHPASTRIRQWFRGGGSPLLPGDPQPSPSVSFDPPLL